MRQSPRLSLRLASSPANVGQSLSLFCPPRAGPDLVILVPNRYHSKIPIFNYLKDTMRRRDARTATPHPSSIVAHPIHLQTTRQIGR
jgi:hypothetical protein